MTDRQPVGCRICKSWIGSCRGKVRGCPVEDEFRSKRLKAAIWIYVIIAAALIGFFVFTSWTPHP